MWIEIRAVQIMREAMAIPPNITYQPLRSTIFGLVRAFGPQWGAEAA